MSPDIVRVSMRAGSWVDEAERKDLPVVAEFDLGSIYEFPIPEEMQLVHILREEGLEPWQANCSKNHYFANASVESFGLVVSLGQLLAPVLANASAEVVAEQIIKAVWRWLPLKPWASRSFVSLAVASRSAQEYFVWRDQVSPGDVEEVAGEQVEDGFAFTVRNKRTSHLYKVRCAPDGRVLARLSLTLLEGFDRLQGSAGNTKQQQDDTRRLFPKG